MEEKFYITRKADLFERTTGKGITLQEWMRFVAQDPEMRLDNSTTVTLADGTSYTYESPGTAVWLDRAPGAAEAREVLFDYADGSILVIDPDERTIEKMRHIAFKLNTHLFKETKRWTEELPVALPISRKVYPFSSMLAPLKKSLPRIGYFFQQFAFASHRHDHEKLKDS